MELFLLNYGFFLAKTITVVVALLVVIFAIIAAASKGKGKESGRLVITKLNKKYEETKDLVDQETHSKSVLKTLKKAKKALQKAEKQRAEKKKRMFILNFNGDLKASGVGNLREEITAILLSATPKDQVLLRLESPGGAVNAYGLAASQLKRFRDAKIKLTIAIDKVAASGGYMMAAVGDKIIAAPFSFVGSVGVVMQLPNFYRFLQKHNIDYEQITAGQYKRTLSLFAENTEEGRKKAKEEVDETHVLFKDFIRQNRPQVNVEQIATGEYWLAAMAKEFNLVDELKTSDDFLLEAQKEHELFEIQYKTKKSLSKRISSGVNSLLEYPTYGS